MENGPFQFISKSHKKYFKEDYDILNRKRHGHKRIKFESKLEKKHKEKIITFTGDLGSFCLADTNGLHRGLTPKKVSDI